MEREMNQQYKKGLWTEEEDKVLLDYIKVHGKGQWNRLAKKTGLKRCGKSCRLRWMNYLSPNVKRGGFSDEENDLIIRLHRLLGNRWALIAGRVPGRTDNQVKNYWNSHLSKKLGLGKKITVGQVSSQTVSRSIEKAPTEPPPVTFSSIPYSCSSKISREAIETQKAVVEPAEIHDAVFSRGVKDTFWASSDELQFSMASNFLDFFGDYSFDPFCNNL